MHKTNFGAQINVSFETGEFQLFVARHYYKAVNCQESGRNGCKKIKINIKLIRCHFKQRFIPENIINPSEAGIFFIFKISQYMIGSHTVISFSWAPKNLAHA
jgi:hypothetical protein